MTRAAVAAVLVAAGLVRSAGADAEYTVTETLIAEWLWDNENGRTDDDYYWDIKSRLNIGLREPGLDAGIRVDVTTFRYFMPDWMGGGTDEERAELERRWYARHGKEPEPDGSYPVVGDYRLERAYAILDLVPGWRLSAGDYYAQFGRGLSLSMRKMDELGVDNALRGARIDGTLADRVDLTLLGGLANVSNVDERFNLISEDPLDAIVGGRVAVGLWGGNRVELHSAYMNGRAEDVSAGEDALTYGGVLEFLDLPYGITVFAEADGLRRMFPGGNSDDAVAAYCDLGVALDPVHMRLEYKYYDDFLLHGTGKDATGIRWEYNHMPFADSEDQLLESPYEVQGGQLRVDVQITGELSVFVAAAGADGLNADNDYDAVHAYGGAEFFWDEHRSMIRASGGYRHAWQTLAYTLDDPDPAYRIDGVDYRTVVHVKLDSTLHLWRDLSLTAGALHEEFRLWDPGNDPADNPVEYRRGTVAVSLDWGGLGGVFGTFEYDTQNQSAGVANYFGSGGIQAFPFDWLVVRARVGSQRGGRKCVSGVCRDFPPIDGARLELVVRL